MKNGPKIIEPVSFRPKGQEARPQVSSRLKGLKRVAGGMLVLLSAYAFWFVFNAQQVFLRIAPEPDRISLRGALFTPRVGRYCLLRPGNYVLKVSKKGYRHLEHRFTVPIEKGRTREFLLEKRPGRLTLKVHPSDNPAAVVAGAEVFLDGRRIGLTPLANVAVRPGSRQLRISADHYLDFKTTLTIEGMETSQVFSFALLPGWARITIDSAPRGAQVLIGGVTKGLTPLEFKLAAGVYELVLHAQGYKTHQAGLEVQAGRDRDIGPVTLQAADGLLLVRTSPAGANVTIGSAYAGQTPIEIPLAPGIDQVVRISKAGYEKIERSVRVAAGATRELELTLRPHKSIVYFVVQPADARLYVNGKLHGTVPESLRLIAVPQRLEIKKEGYTPYRTTITPRPGFPQELSVILKKKFAASPATAAVIKAFNGYSLKLIKPAAFTLGSSRREQGRRSNETLRNVTLKRVFYMGVREVTQQEFRQFRAGHDSGLFKGQRLNRPDQPVARVSWEDAALFCNWLSEKEKLPPVYLKREGKLVAQAPLATGYRLPTEAEWEYCARFANNQATLRYPWGGGFPPSTKKVNIADVSAKDLLSGTIETYNDGYAVTAPPASFAANALGLHDLGGNVAEWCHDYYSIYTSSSKGESLDPSGPPEGKHHVVRGSSWKHAGISALRAAYRDYANDQREDLGFRVCRYKE